MNYKEVTEALRVYTQDLIAYKLGCEFANAVVAADDMILELRNELCWKCERYKEEHLGACTGCKWRDG